MPRAAAKHRYLLTYTKPANGKKLFKLLEGRKKSEKLLASTAIGGAVQENSAIINPGIGVISVPLTSSEVAEVKEARLCCMERDRVAFACEIDSMGVETALREYPYPWGVKKIDADIAWETTKGKGVRVAVLDTGIDSNHPNLKPNVKKGISYVENVTTTEDDNGHGTHCAGIIVATPGAKQEGICGVAPEASVFPVKVLNYNGIGSTTSILSGLEWCLNNRIEIVSMSFRIPSDQRIVALEQACEKLWDADILMVAAVGNDREDKKPKRLRIGFPAAYDTVIGVGATDKYDTIAAFSNIGKGIDLVAPGVNVLSTYRSGRFRELSGTSQACPYVAGTAALLKSHRRTLHNHEIKKVLIETCDPLGTSQADEIYGQGLVNASGAIEQLDSILG